MSRTKPQLLLALLFLGLSPVFAQDDPDSGSVVIDSYSTVGFNFGGLDNADEMTLAQIRKHQEGVSHASLDLGFADSGLSFGNSAVWNGVRLNWHDRAVRSVRGLNVTLWRPGPNVDGSIGGVAVGLWGPRADELHGVSLGLLSVRAREKLHGLWFGGLVVEAGEMHGVGASLFAQVSHGETNGIFVSGLANVSGDTDGEAFEAAMDELGRQFDELSTMEHDDHEARTRHIAEVGGTLAGDDNMHGIAVAGLANVRNGSMHGVQLAGFTNVGNGSVHGLQGSFLANVSNGSMHGINLSGLVNVSNGSMHGIELSGLTNVHNGSAIGISGTLLANVTNGTFQGISVAGLTNVNNGTSMALGASLLANVNNGEAMGLYATGLVNVNNGDSLGLFVSGLANVHEGSLAGTSLSLGVLHATHLTGFGVGGVYAHTNIVEGAVIGLWNEVEGKLDGLQLGVYNDAVLVDEGLQLGVFNEAVQVGDGVMIGLLNHVPSNPVWARWLPLFNTSF